MSVHCDDDGEALHGREEGEQMVHVEMMDGLLFLGPEEAFDPSRNALIVVEGAKSFPEEDPTAAGTREVRRRLVVPKRRMRKMKVAEGGGGTIEKYFSKLCVKGMVYKEYQEKN